MRGSHLNPTFLMFSLLYLDGRKGAGLWVAGDSAAGLDPRPQFYESIQGFPAQLHTSFERPSAEWAFPVGIYAGYSSLQNQLRLLVGYAQSCSMNPFSRVLFLW